jgi:hypothetical protein
MHDDDELRDWGEAILAGVLFALVVCLIFLILALLSP